MVTITNRSAWLPTATMDGPGSLWWTLHNSVQIPTWRELSGKRCQWKLSHRKVRYIGLMRADEQEEVTQRLRSARGHLKATFSMLDAGEPCEIVLHQLGLVQAALSPAQTELL